MSRDWLDKNFYATLGIPQDASISEIKKAYKKLARENHPDLNPGDLEAEKRFNILYENNLIFVTGSVPGANNGLVYLSKI